jgi:thiamine pyrophosphokinase
MLPATPSIALVANGSLGDSPQLAHELRRYETLIAVDGGLNHCYRLGVTPHLVVGDFDSVDPDVLAHYHAVPRRMFPRDKDQTDLELALQEVFNTGSETAVAYGALGRRTDHLLANLQLLRRYPVRLFYQGEDERLFAVVGEYRLECHPGQVLSLIPLGGPVEGVTTKGLKWELTDATFNKEFFSISNECTGDEVRISIAKGDLVCSLYH